MGCYGIWSLVIYMKTIWKVLPIISCGLLNGYNLPNSNLNPPVTFNNGFVGSVEYLYWKGDPRVVPVVKGMFTRSLTSVTIDAELQTNPFKWSSGVRGSLGYQFCNTWTFEAGYTYYQTDVTQKFIGDINSIGSSLSMQPGIGLLPITGIIVVSDTHFKGNFSLNQTDFLFNRAFLVGPQVVLTPFTGVKCLFINQNLSTYSIGGGPNSGQFVDFKALEHYSGYGLTAGLKSMWNMLSHLSFVGEGGISLLYARNHIKWIERTDTPQPNIDSDFHLSEMNYTLDAGLGIVWSQNIFSGKFNVKVGWEWHYISDISKVPTPQVNAGIPITDIPSYPLTLQGVVVGISFLI